MDQIKSSEENNEKDQKCVTYDLQSYEVWIVLLPDKERCSDILKSTLRNQKSEMEPFSTSLMEKVGH